MPLTRRRVRSYHNYAVAGGTTVSPPTLLTSGKGTSSTTTITTIGLTPSATAVTVVSLYVSNTTTPTISGGRGTWTLAKRQNNAGVNGTLYRWVGTGTASTGPITISVPAGTGSQYLYEVKEYEGGHQSTPLVAANTLGVTHSSANTVCSITPAQPLGAGNAFDVAFGFNGGGGSGTPRAGWTELLDQFNTSTSWFESQYRLSTDSAAEVTLPSAGFNGAGILLEIAHA